MISTKKVKKKLKSDGYVIVKGFFLEIEEFKNFKNFLSRFIKFGLNNKKNIFMNIDKSLSLAFKKNVKISSFFNDNINLTPYLSALFTSKKLTSFLSKILNVTRDEVIWNNQRFRTQIPGNDEIANLPWHQDAAYNKIKDTKSIVAWISVGNISEDMGPIILKKSSHKFGIQKQIRFKKSNGLPSIKVNCNNKNLKNLEDVSLETLSGDLILIDMNTVHASGKNTTKDKVKYSAQARYHVVRQQKT